MNSLHHLWMKTYLQLNRMVLDRAAALGLSPGSQKFWNFWPRRGSMSRKPLPTTARLNPPPWAASSPAWRPRAW